MADEAIPTEAETVNTGPMINIVIWVVTVAATVFLALRLYCKISRKKRPWYDDYVLIASWVCLVSSNIITSINVTLGLGRATSTIEPANLPTLGLLRLINASLSLLGVIWSKTAFAVTLLRLVHGKTLLFVWFLIVTGNMFFLASVLFGWLQCIPVDKNWIFTKPGRCVDPSVRLQFNIVGGIYSGIMDIILALVPWNILRDLKMHTREKLGVGFAMSMGIFAGIAAFIKTGNINHSGAIDFNKDGYPIILWSTAEIAITISAASIPTLRVLVREVASQVSKKHQYYRQREEDGDDLTRLASEHRAASSSGKSGEHTWELAELDTIGAQSSPITPFEIAMGVKYPPLVHRPEDIRRDGPGKGDCTSSRSSNRAVGS